MKASASILVWPSGLRLFHWSLAAAVIISFATHERLGNWHFVAGYAAIFLVLLRVVLGFFGSSAWRFSVFVRSPKAVLSYTRQVLKRSEARHIHHNPLGAYMVLLLLLNTFIAGVSGWLSITDWGFGNALVGFVHTVSGEAVVPLLLLHLAGVFYGSWRHKENLIKAMLNGKKRSN